MRDPVLRVVKDFLSPRLQRGGTVLLGFSGGLDSSALLALLVECKFFLTFDLHIAHFDHAWREESFDEALKLKEQIELLGCVFHVRRSKGASLSNKEEEARNERYGFFEEIYKKIDAQALLLAHQMEDQAETVLKRIFEGAGLLSLGGMEEESSYKGMVIWRPFLHVSRKTLLDWNEKNGVKFLVDSTNSDLHFLRPRLREKIFPYLETWFGKGVQKNLSFLSGDFSLVKQKMERDLKVFLEKKIEGGLGFFLPMQEVVDALDRQELIRFSLREKNVIVGRDAVHRIDSLLSSRLSDKRVDVEKGDLLVDQGNLIWLNYPVVPFRESRLSLESQTIFSLGWSWEIKIDAKKFVERSPLLSFLEGEIHYKIPSGSKGLSPFVLSSYDDLDDKDRKKLSFFLSKNKVPSKLRRIFPFITSNGKLIDLSFLFNLNIKKDVSLEFLTIKLKKTSN